MKKLFLSIKQHPVVYFLLTALFIGLNVLIDGTLIKGDDSGWFTTEDSYLLMSLLTLAAMLVILCFSAPFFLCAENGPNICNRVFLFYFPFAMYVILQTLQVIVFVFAFESFDISVSKLVIFAAIGLLTIFYWVVLLGIIYFAASNLAWYFIGVVAVFISPVALLYISNMALDLSDTLLYFVFTPAFLPMLLGSNPIVALIAAVPVITIFFVTLLAYMKNKIKLNSALIYKIFKLIVMCPVSLSAGVFLLKYYNVTDKYFVILYAFVTLLVFVILCSYAFQKYRFMTVTLITAVAVGIVAIIVLSPPIRIKQSQRPVAVPPESQDIDYVKIRLDGLEEYRLDYSFGSCIELNNRIIELRKGEYDSSAMRDDPDCLADVWNSISFNYTLKNGRTGAGYYDNLNDSVFDDFFIEYLRSDAYEASFDEFFLREETMLIQYVSEDPDRLVRELDKTKVEGIIDIYCDELDSTDEWAFYEPYDTLLIENANGSGDRNIYIPQSFAKTRDAIKNYMNQYTAY